MKTTIIKPFLLILIACFCSILFSYKWNKTSSIPNTIAGKWSLVRFYPAKKDTFKYMQTVSLLIEGDGITAGFLGCNKFRTECTANGNNIRFGTILSSRKFCEREYMDLEDEIKSLLIRANTFSIIDNTLILSEGKTKLASFKKQ